MALGYPQEGLAHRPAVLHASGQQLDGEGKAQSLNAGDLDSSRNTCPLVYEFQGVEHVTSRQPHNLAGEAAFLLL